MSRCIIPAGTDVKALRKQLKKSGFVLRSYKQPDGSVRYTIRTNTYRGEFDLNQLLHDDTDQ